MRWTGHVARMWERRNSYIQFWLEKDHSEDMVLKLGAPLLEMTHVRLLDILGRKEKEMYPLRIQSVLLQRVSVMRESVHTR
jgi:hypothetical protein